MSDQVATSTTEELRATPPRILLNKKGLPIWKPFFHQQNLVLLNNNVLLISFHDFLANTPYIAQFFDTSEITVLLAIFYDPLGDSFTHIFELLIECFGARSIDVDLGVFAFSKGHRAET